MEAPTPHHSKPVALATGYSSNTSGHIALDYYFPRYPLRCQGNNTEERGLSDGSRKTKSGYRKASVLRNASRARWPTILETCYIQDDPSRVTRRFHIDMTYSANECTDVDTSVLGIGERNGITVSIASQFRDRLY